jgi:hypothetical protein
MRVFVMAAALAAAGCVGGGGGGGGAPLPFERGELSPDGAPRCDLEQWCDGVLLAALLKAEGSGYCLEPVATASTPDTYDGVCVPEASAAQYAADPCSGATFAGLWGFSVSPTEVLASVRGARGAGARQWSARCTAEGAWAHEVVFDNDRVDGRIDRFDEDGNLLPEVSTPR